MRFVVFALLLLFVLWTSVAAQSQQPLAAQTTQGEPRPQQIVPAQPQSQSSQSVLGDVPTALETLVDPLSSHGHGHISHKSLVDDTVATAKFSAMKSAQSGEKGTMGIPDRPPLVNFENNVPPRRLNASSNPSVEETTITLITHSFANSYGKPAYTKYSPSILLPANFQDSTRWISLSLDQEGKARGRQFDRLGSVYLSGVEVVRTDNAEPVNTTGGIIWRTKKDVSRYFNLFSKEGDLVFDYPNIVDETYTAPLNLTLSLTVQQLKGGDGNDGVNTQDCQLVVPSPLHNRTPQIYAISKGDNTTSPSQFLVPNDTASVNLTIPRNGIRALVEVYASGTAQDEFWYTGINDDLYRQTIDDNHQLIPHGPYREIQITIDGQVAGISAPYPVIFTGGLNPLLWRPQTSWGSYDQPTYLFDITPFLGLISDGNPHTYGISIRSAESNEQIPSGWFVTGNLQLELSNNADAITIGEKPTIQGPGPTRNDFDLTGQVIDSNFTGGKGSLLSNVNSIHPRAMTIVGKIVPSGTKIPIDIRVQYSFEYTSFQNVTKGGSNQKQASTTSGTQKSYHGSLPFLSIDYSFPLITDTTYDTTSLNASVKLQYKQSVRFGNADTIPPQDINCGSSDVNTAFGLPSAQSYDVRQDAAAQTRIHDGKLSGGLGGNNVSISYRDSWGFTFHRTVKTYNYTVTDDEISGTLKDSAPPVQ